MIETKTLKTGDPVYVRFYDNYSLRAVAKVTPSGMVDIKLGNIVERFRENGIRCGDGPYSNTRLDLEMPVAERRSLVEANDRRIDAIREFNQLECIHRAMSTDEKSDLLRRITEVQSLVDAARAKVEAI